MSKKNVRHNNEVKNVASTNEANKNTCAENHCKAQHDMDACAEETVAYDACLDDEDPGACTCDAETKDCHCNCEVCRCSKSERRKRTRIYQMAADVGKTVVMSAVATAASILVTAALKKFLRF